MAEACMADPRLAEVMRQAAIVGTPRAEFDE